MEKKTLGSFIAVLRKSRGITQKELAEQLGVSDKIISHWERDESAPDISIIPVIAEIFDVTCDELLKGEKTKNPTESSPHKTQKQQKYFFEKDYSRFRTQCLIFVGVAFLGLAFSLLSYWMWAWNLFLVDLMFFIISVFGLVITKLQSKNIFLDEDFDGSLAEKYQKKSKETFWYSILSNIVITSLCAEPIGFLIAPVVGAITYLILRLTGQITFKKKGEIIEKSVVKTVSIVLIIIVAFSLVFFEGPRIFSEMNTPKPVLFENMEELKSFMETKRSYPAGASGERGTNTETNIVLKDKEYVWQCYDGSEEEMIVEFVWRNNEIQHIEFSFDENGKCFAEAMFYQNDIGEQFYRITEPLFYAFYPVVILSGIIVCVSGIKKKLREK